MFILLNDSPFIFSKVFQKLQVTQLRCGKKINDLPKFATKSIQPIHNLHQILPFLVRCIVYIEIEFSIFGLNVLVSLTFLVFIHNIKLILSSKIN